MKERNIRDNNKLRKLVTPTNARDAIKKLNDKTKTQDVNISNIIKPTKIMTTGGPPLFVAEAMVNSVTLYKGTGRTKNASTKDLYDQILRDIILRKMQTSASKYIKRKSGPPLNFHKAQAPHGDTNISRDPLLLVAP